MSKPFLLGWSRRKKITVTATYFDRDLIVDLTIHRTSGIDESNVVYLNGNVRTDWGDIRFTRSDGVTVIPYAILRNDGTTIEVSLRVNVKNGQHYYYIYWDGPAADSFKIGRTTDQHYDPNGASGGSSEQDRVNTITKLAAFNTRMGIFQPDLILHGGDHSGARSSVEATQLSWMEAVFDETQNGPIGTPVAIVSPGNHDFEFVSDTNFRALLDDYQSWMETGVMYGKAFENDDYIVLSLDSNYNPSGGAHLSIQHLGSGFVNGSQLDWLRTQLEAATKPVIIDIHHPCAEQDTDQFTLTKEIYHTVNRLDVRNVIEQSGKVIAVLHGHMHFTRLDVVKGIPYITCTNLTEDGSFGEVPLSTDGKWTELTFDKSSKNINVKHVALISGNYETVYESNLPFGKTSFFTDVSNHPEEVFKESFGAAFGKSSILRDPTQLYVVNDNYLYKFPVNLYTPDPSPLFKESILIEGRTNSPNFGRAIWTHENFGEYFIFRGWVMPETNTQQFILKFGGKDVTTDPSIYIAFNTDGRIHILHGSGITDFDFGAYSALTWYEIELFVQPEDDLWNGRINGVEIGLLGFYGPITNQRIFRQLEIVTQVGNTWISGFSLRKWHLPRPNVNGFGSEEIQN